jgi:hypothetical protein
MMSKSVFRRVRSTHHNGEIRSKNTLSYTSFVSKHTLVRSAHPTRPLQTTLSDSVLSFTFYLLLFTFYFIL